jgi:hypothetical protein
LGWLSIGGGDELNFFLLATIIATKQLKVSQSRLDF